MIKADMDSRKQLVELMDGLKKLAEDVAALPNDDPTFDEQLATVANMDARTYQDFLTQRAATPYGLAWNRFKAAAIRLLDVYIEADEHVQHVMRREAAQSVISTQLYRMVDEEVWLLTSPNDNQLLCRLLAVFSLLDEGEGIGQELELSLSRVCNVAEEAKIDYEIFLKQIAGISSSSPPMANPNGISTRQFLREFEPIKGW